MNFKDLKQGYSVHLLDRNTMMYSTEKVTSVSMPHVDAKMTATGMVVDVTTENGTYCMTADTDIAYPYNKVITTDRCNILRELEAIRAASQQRIDNIIKDEHTVKRCNELIAELDPAEKEKQATEARFSNIEQSMEKMMQMLENLTE